jgi:hypothetical protein
MTSMIFRLLAASAAALSPSATAADGEKQQPSQAQERADAQGNQSSEISKQAQIRQTGPEDSTGPSTEKPPASGATTASIAAASNPRGGPSSSSERTAEPAPGGYGPPAGEPPSDKK